MPFFDASSSAPRTTSLKNGFCPSSTTKPTVELVPARSWRAASLRRYPSVSIAFCTRVMDSAETSSGRLSTLDTVPTETPASLATSRMLVATIEPPSACPRAGVKVTIASPETTQSQVA